MLVYRATAMQIACHPINDCPDKAAARAKMRACLERLKVTVPGARVSAGPDMRLVVLPEYFMTGFPLGTPIPKWAEWAAVDVDGPEYETLAAIAANAKVYLAGNAYVRDKNFPGIFFQGCFIFDPSGKLVLHYHRLTSMFSPTPHDFLDKYLDLYGAEALFPVARTPIGNLACIASEEIQYPELVRCFALKGAEVFCHPTSEPYKTGLTPKDIMKRARAIENLTYVVSANTSGMIGYPFLDYTCDGLSKIVDFEGQVLAEAGFGESVAATADINITMLRRARNKTDINNFLTRMRMELYSGTYARKDFYPPNSLIGKEPTHEHFKTMQQQVIDRLRKVGVIEAE
ncbi:MAG: nitrilase-related carbon-nitrogen hydrolase [Rhodospirillaceae bacterium]|nr:nitrilase-related carbon-nitrogen hydrolase [Rhodospirillaceae bacterium]